MARSRSNSVELAMVQLVALLAGGGAFLLHLKLTAVLSIVGVGLLVCIIIMSLKVLKPKSPSRAATVPRESVDHVRPTIARVCARPKITTLNDRLEKLDWYQFERLLAAIYREKGYQVERSGGAKPDGGIDFILRLGHIELAVQCKHWKSWQVGVKEIREFLGALRDAGVQNGRFIALKDFSQDAIALARRHNVQLVSGKDLEKLMAEVNWEYNPAIRSILDETTKVCPKCDSSMVLRTARNGSRAGDRFWGCSNYPRCEGKLPWVPAAETATTPVRS